VQPRYTYIEDEIEGGGGGDRNYQGGGSVAVPEP
jgi:hypothetical protein